MQGKTVDFILKIEFSSLVELLFSLGLQKPIENKGFLVKDEKDGTKIIKIK